jgi:uncharacterized repeat protein (TIGR01451 family)
MKSSGTLLRTVVNRQEWISSLSHRLRNTVGRCAAAFAAFVILTALYLTASGILSPRHNIVSAFEESISTFASSDCATPKNSWNLGETACAVAIGADGERRIAWIAPDGSVARVSNAFVGTANDSYTIPTGSDPLAQVGTWKVTTIDASNSAFVEASFVVRDPATASADLSLSAFGPFQVSPGSSVSYRIELRNNGPDEAQSVTLTNPVPADETFISEQQDSGPGFSCSTPPSGSGSGAIVCSLPAMAPNTTAIFTLVFNVNGGAAGGEIITDAASVSSTTHELHQGDNTASSSATVFVTTNTCTITCPSDVGKDNDPDQCGAVVTYPAPSGSAACGSDTITCVPPSGSFFPIGPTPVSCSTQGGGDCSFTVTVHDTRPPVAPTIDCPANISVGEDSPGQGSAVVTYPAPTTTGNCVTTSCVPPSGSRFALGPTTVNCTATDSANNTVTCSFTVTVTNGASCTLTCPGDVTVTAPAGQCSATVTYPAPTTSGNCGVVTCTPASGTVFLSGTTPVTCSSDQGPSCTFSVTVTAAAPPTITSCAANRTLIADANCEATLPDMTSEVHATGCSVTISQSPAAGTVVNPGTYTITFMAENSACDPDAVPPTCPTCTAIVTVVDNTPPVITTCPGPASAAADANCQAAVPAVTTSVTASDNCTPAGSLTITQNPAAGTLVGKGITTITITVRDQANNSATCTTTFTVSDVTPPTIGCPANITQPTDPGQCTAIVSYAPVVSDNCPGAVGACAPASGSIFQKGTTLVTCMATDASGNTSAPCSFTVTVVDLEAPAITCPTDVIVDFDPAVGGAVVNYATPVGTDNCPGATTAQIAGLPSGSTFPLGTTTNTFKVTDAAGNSTQCSFKVTVALTSIIGVDSVTINGSGFADSYDSTGGYPATKGNLANVVSNGTITLGNSGKVFGNVRSTRAGVVMSGATQVTGDATAGTTVSRSGSAVVGGTITNNQLAPVITLPAVAACGPPYSPNSGITGTYSYNPSTGDLSLSGTNIATLANGTYCFHNVTLTNSAQLRVNGLVVIKLTGTLTASGATSITNATNIPGNLRIISSYSGSNGVSLTNGTGVYLVIYAPNTGVTISGSVPAFGTVAAKTVTISSGGALHYDVQLKSIWPDIWSMLP